MSHAFNNERFFFISAWLFAFLGMTQTTFAKLQTNDDSLCKQPEYIYFERKNYYYPDLPKGYQITQETKPAPVGIYGELEYEYNDEIKIAKINNIHLEEDSAGMTHEGAYSTINYNRAGVPLLELVTEPTFSNADETIAFLETMRSIYQYAGISEADAKKGQIRCDVNISIMDENLDETNPCNLLNIGVFMKLCNYLKRRSNPAISWRYFEGIVYMLYLNDCVLCGINK